MPKVTISGSFKRDPDGLLFIYSELTSYGCQILSPRSAEPVRTEDGFVFMKGDDLEPIQIERRHLHAIEESDFVWLYAPQGYVGVSAAMEVGWAVAKGIPVFSTDKPTDPVLADMVHVVPKLKIGAYTGVVIRLNGKFLTMHFTKKKEREWRFAGGKVEPGENAFGCVVRELKEELGVDAASAKLVFRHTHAVDSGIWTGYYFLIEPVGVPRIMEPDKNDDLAYIDADRLEELGSYPECEVARLLEEQDKKA